MRTTTSIRRVAAALLLLVLVSLHSRAAGADIATPVTTATESTESTVAEGDIVPEDIGAIGHGQTNQGQKDFEQGAGGAASLALRGDEVWMISTRHLSCLSGKGETAFDLEVSLHAGEDNWVAAGLDELLAGEPRLTVIYVHGNRVSFDDAITRAWTAFGHLQADPSAPPMRLIIWTWPSDRIHGQIRDVRAKGARTNTESQYLAWFLSQLHPESSINMIGYSYGARVITGALHVLGGGTLIGQNTPLPNAGRDRNPIGVVLMAGALHNYWLASGGYHEQFWSLADRLLVLYNSCDPVLKRYRFIEKRGRPAALGYTGAWGLDVEGASRTEQHDVCCSVGKTHDESIFFSSAEVIEGLQRHVLTNAPHAAY